MLFISRFRNRIHVMPLIRAAILGEGETPVFKILTHDFGSHLISSLCTVFRATVLQTVAVLDDNLSDVVSDVFVRPSIGNDSIGELQGDRFYDRRDR